jgi:NarL family two-component system response regulator LiaR
MRMRRSSADPTACSAYSGNGQPRLAEKAIPGGGSPIRVLIVDDETLFAEMLASSLESRGVEVVGTAANGRAAVALARAVTPDMVLMDLGLPDIDGLTAGKRILADRPDTKVLAITGLNDAGMVREAIRAGFQGYVMKETSLSELLGSLMAVARTQSVLPREAAQALAGMRSKEQDAELLAEQLTARERQILTLLSEGVPGRDLAHHLHLSPNTVRTHIQNICSKLQVHSRLEAVAFAMRHGIVPTLAVSETA